ncbi:hypothetical protein H6F43_03790 [Leptolyngbya sp. FACHB-36]|uniref:hypothetical protein n=1 Tax=Leptolyngbya sp. FACHB-36 TaxID=2692808 RepID=UPI0016803DEF|nr:hypothetical protein [Leptolyngbya sp. FACHB-36]MBD2019304.1 hypothetical protein [Leptolyngbya sp. FACHB-36]
MVRQLPSGFWAWVPSHPEDLAIVAEHRKEQFEFGRAQYLYCQIEVVPEDYQRTRICADIKRELKQEIGCRFLELMQSDKIYKTAISFREGRSTSFPGMFCVQITLIYSEADSATASGLSFAPVPN